MINLKAEPKPHKDADTMMCAPCYDEPAYPYGLTLSLNRETLDKLGIKGLPAVGAVMKIVAKAVVTSVSQRQEADGEDYHCIELQITDMDQPTAASAMFDNSLMNP